jgi:hypothetical protein
VALVTAIAGVVSALAAMAALWFALQTVRETQRLRREDRLSQLASLVGDLGAASMQFKMEPGPYPAGAFAALQVQVQAALDAAGESAERLPLTAALPHADLLDAEVTSGELLAKVEGALGELGERLREQR